MHSLNDVSRSVPGILNSPVVESNRPSSMATFRRNPSDGTSYLDFGGDGLLLSHFIGIILGELLSLL